MAAEGTASDGSAPSVLLWTRYQFTADDQGATVEGVRAELARRCPAGVTARVSGEGATAFIDLQAEGEWPYPSWREAARAIEHWLAELGVAAWSLALLCSRKLAPRGPRCGGVVMFLREEAGAAPQGLVSPTTASLETKDCRECYKHTDLGPLGLPVYLEGVHGASCELKCDALAERLFPATLAGAGVVAAKFDTSHATMVPYFCKLVLAAAGVGPAPAMNSAHAPVDHVDEDGRTAAEEAKGSGVEATATAVATATAGDGGFGTAAGEAKAARGVETTATAAVTAATGDCAFGRAGDDATGNVETTATTAATAAPTAADVETTGPTDVAGDGDNIAPTLSERPNRGPLLWFACNPQSTSSVVLIPLCEHEAHVHYTWQGRRVLLQLSTASAMGLPSLTPAQLRQCCPSLWRAACALEASMASCEEHCYSPDEVTAVVTSRQYLAQLTASSMPTTFASPDQLIASGLNTSVMAKGLCGLSWCRSLDRWMCGLPWPTAVHATAGCLLPGVGHPPQGSTQYTRKLALVVGCGKYASDHAPPESGKPAYKSYPELECAADDAKEFARVLCEDLGFRGPPSSAAAPFEVGDVALYVDTKRDEIHAAWTALVEAAAREHERDPEAALLIVFYFSGHGMNSFNRTYLVPVNTGVPRPKGFAHNMFELGSQEQVEVAGFCEDFCESLHALVSEVYQLRLDRNSTFLCVLDCCRTDESVDSAFCPPTILDNVSSSATTGGPHIDANTANKGPRSPATVPGTRYVFPISTIVAYACAPGQTAIEPRSATARSTASSGANTSALRTDPATVVSGAGAIHAKDPADRPNGSAAAEGGDFPMLVAPDPVTSALGDDAGKRSVLGGDDHVSPTLVLPSAASSGCGGASADTADVHISVEGDAPPGLERAVSDSDARATTIRKNAARSSDSSTRGATLAPSSPPRSP